MGCWTSEQDLKGSRAFCWEVLHGIEVGVLVVAGCT